MTLPSETPLGWRSADSIPAGLGLLPHPPARAISQILSGPQAFASCFPWLSSRSASPSLGARAPHPWGPGWHSGTAAGQTLLASVNKVLLEPCPLIPSQLTRGRFGGPISPVGWRLALYRNHVLTPVLKLPPPVSLLGGQRPQWPPRGQGGGDRP